MFHTMMQNMFHLQVPLLEKILRPMLVYVCLVVFLRVFGKRELAQLNPFDLVVLLSLSNTVQNAMIGDDNTVSGGLIGAFSLMAINWITVRMMYFSPKAERVLTGAETVLIKHGRMDHKAMARELITEEELLSVIRKQNFDAIGDVQKCVLEPNGSFYIAGREPSADDAHHQELLTRLDALQAELKMVKAKLA